MEENKILFILFGTKPLIENFKEIHSEFRDEMILLNSIDNLRSQVSLILEDDELSKNKNIFLEVNEYDVGIFEHIIDETSGMNNLLLKFVVLNDKEDPDKEDDILNLVQAIEKYTKDYKVNDAKGIQREMSPLDQDFYDEINEINMFTMKIDNASYLVETVFKAFGCTSIPELPKGIREDMNDSMRKLIKKHNGTL